MPKRRTFFYDPARLVPGVADDLGEFRNTLLARTRMALQDQQSAPATEIQALMESPPHTDPRTSAVERDVDFGPLTEALATLGDRERWIVEALFWRRMSLRDLGAELAMSKTQVSRIRDCALVKLRDALAGVRPADLVSILGSFDDGESELRDGD